MAMSRPEGAGLRAPAAWLAATRPGFLGITAVAVSVGLAAAAFDGIALDGWRAMATLAGALLVHAGANAVNDFHDRIADAGNADRIAPFTGGSRLIQEGVLAPRTMALIGYGLLALGAAMGVLLALSGAPPLWWVGGAGLALALAYSAPPARLSGRGLGEWVIATAWLLVVVGADAALRGDLAARPVAAGLSVSLMVAAILLANGFPDRRADAAAGKRTLVVALGPKRAARAHLALVLGAHAGLVVLVFTGQLPGLALLAVGSLPWSVASAVRLLGQADAAPGPALRPALSNSIAAAHLHGLLLAGALAVARG